MVSAFGGADLDQLIEAGKAAAHKGDYQWGFEELKQRHLSAAKKELGVDLKATARVEGKLQEFSALLETLSLDKELSLKKLDLIMSFGELLSAFIISEALKREIKEVRFVDAQEPHPNRSHIW